MPKLQNELWDQLIAEFPPLWNPQDLCFRDLHVRSQCRQLLLEKANRLSSVPITMESLRKRLRNVNQRLRKGSDQESLGSVPSLLASTNPDSTRPLVDRICMREIAAEYPCLWDSSDVNYMNVLMKTNCEEQLLVKYNNLASTPITMVQLREKLQDLRQQWSGETPTENREPEEVRPPTAPRLRRLEELMKEFPCAWDREAPGYFDRRVKKLTLTKLLHKYNSMRTEGYQINFSQLKTMIAYIKRKQRRPNENQEPEEVRPPTAPRLRRLEDLMKEFPCVWDREAPGYFDRRVKRLTLTKLLHKYNSMRTEGYQINLYQLKTMIAYIKRKQRRVQPIGNQEPEERRPPTPPRFRRLEDLMKEFPCVWDREAPGYFDRRTKKLTLTKLMHKYNSMTTESYQINLSQLKTMIETIKRKQRRFPCLCDREAPGYFNWRMKKLALTRLLEVYNSMRPSSCQINYTQMSSMVANIRRRQKRTAAAGRRSEDTRADWQSDVGNSSDSTDQVNLSNQAGVLSIVFHCCAICGEVKSEGLNHNDKSYIENNKTTLTFNNLSVELNYDKDATVCQNCDKKLKEMHEFVKLVKNAQDKMNGVNVADVITLDDDDDDDNDDQKFIIDSVTVTDTEVTPRVSHKRKSEETPELKKKCRVTIDLNSCDDDRSMDDIAKYRMFKNDGIVVDANDPEKVLKVIGTGYGEDITFHVKEEIDTDDIHEEVDETGDISTDDDKSNIVIADTRTRNSEDVMKQKEADDILKNEVTSKTVTHEEKQNDIDGNGEVVNKEDNRNGIINEHTNNSEITSAAASTSKEPVCVMPKSELIGLVESIVSRMLNK